MNIRPAEARDLEACLALDPSFDTEYVWQMEPLRMPEVFGAGFRATRLPRAMRVPAEAEREKLEDHFERGECFWVAEENGVIRGYVDMTADRTRRAGRINYLVVAPDRRRRGVGSQLLKQALAWAREQECKIVRVAVTTKNHPAASMLQRHGFAFCGYDDRFDYKSRDIAIFFAAAVK